MVIGSDLRFDPVAKELRFDRANYFDTMGKENKAAGGIRCTDTELLRFVANIYPVLLTRGIRATHIYMCDLALREHLRPLFSA